MTQVARRVPPTTFVKPRSGWRTFDPWELWRFRELLYFLTWRDIKVRYKQTAIGAGWAILQPLLSMLAFSVIFGRLIGVPSNDIPYPVFVYAGLLPWTFFASAVNRSAVSLVSNSGLVSKVYFPRLVVPIGAVLANAPDFGVAFVILLVMMAAFGIVPTVAVFALPFVLLLALLAAVGVGLWLSALNVKYRDVAHVLPFLMQFWFFLSPVAYPSTIVPQPWQAIYALNPMAIVVEGFRWSVLGAPGPSVELSVVSLALLLALFCSGVLYFRHAEDEFADVV